ncbi:F0F1 ATP synthase subunit B [Mahella sp.]|jgi:F-type H+-transporting ATPase subunit b|uniref:F0F1 ATP synthase subunit B n=1 Tax=Mahella sp. TaxID=2798721 RepID=UPI0025C1A74C|nr:F0F1 ATP synthase subunit B [Mahella sp.]MBZ4665058.1 synthase subunit [Mahella sp.]MDK2991140.1 F-type H+-transporting ATPase subunit b [Clostridiales bacterium]
MWDILATPIFVVINLFILYYILKKLLYKPLMNFMENRSKNIQSQLEQAKTRQQQAEELYAQYVQQLNDIKQRSDQLLKETRDKAEQQMNAILNDAKAQAETILTKAQIEAQRQKELTIEHAKDQIAALAMAAVSEILQRELDAETDEQLVKSIIEQGIRG